MAEIKIDPENVILINNDAVKLELEDNGEGDYQEAIDVDENCFLATEDDEDNSVYNTFEDPLELQKYDGMQMQTNEFVPNQAPEIDYPKCGKNLSYYKILVDKLPYRCEDCFLLFDDYMYFRDHRISRHCIDPLVYCNQCKIPCGSKYVYEIHRVTHHSQMSVLPTTSTTRPCEVKSNKKLKKPKKICKMQNSRCKYCNKLVKSVRKMKYHMVTQHPHSFEKELEAKHRKDGVKLPYKCDICISYYTSESSLNSHQVKKHKFQKVYKCSYCQKSFPSSVTKKNHIIECLSPKTPDTSLPKCYQKGEIKTFKCPSSDCKNKYTTESELETHKLKCVFCVTPTHKKCESCGEIITIRRKNNVITHKCTTKIESADKNQQEIKNESVISRKDRNQGHELKCPEDGYKIPQITVPEFECKICGMKFGHHRKSRYRFLLHVRYVHKKGSNTEKKINRANGGNEKRTRDSKINWDPKLDKQDSDLSQESESGVG